MMKCVHELLGRKQENEVELPSKVEKVGEFR